MANFLWKPISEGGLNPGALSVLLGLKEGVRAVGIYDKDDNLIENLAMSPYKEGGTKFYSRKPGSSYGNNLRVKVDYGDRQEAYNIPQGGGRYEGEFGNENPVYSNKKPGAGGGGSGAYLPPGTMGGGQFGGSTLPYYLGGEYPEYKPVDFQPIEGGKYDPIDMENAINQLGQQNRLSVAQNYNVAQGLGLETLNTELAGLKYFAPAAAALSRGQIGQDNQFNQASRTAQIDSAMPGARQSLADQGRRAASYAAGRLPDELLDRALELDVRSGAADAARMGGFGNNSAVAANISDLMSARERLDIAKYGEGLVSSNLNQRQGFELAPTQYSTAGSQIRATPTVDAGTRAQQAVGDLNAATIVNPAQTIQMEQGQRQFQYNAQTDIQKYNSNTGLETQKLNTQNQFSRDLGLFGYNTGYLASVAGAEQSVLNQSREDQLRAESTAQFQEALKAAQDSGDNKAIASIIGQLLGSQSSTTTKNPDGTSTTSSTSLGSSILSGLGSLLGIGGDSTSGGGGSSTQDPSILDTIGSLIGDLFGGDSDSTSGVADAGFDATSSSGQPTGDSQVTLRGEGGGSYYGGNVGGTSNAPKSNYVQTGYNSQGQPVYSSPALAKSSNINQGVSAVSMIGNLLNSFGMGNDSDSSALSSVARASSNPQLLSSLGQSVESGDKTSFKNKILDSIGVDAKARDVIGTSGQLLNTYNNWNNMSTAQKSLAVAQLGLKANGYAGGDFTSKIIPNTNGQLKVGEALGLAAQGYNTIQMVNNWNDMDLTQRIMGVGQTVDGVRYAADALGYGAESAGSAFIGAGSVAPGTLSAAANAGAAGVSAPTLLGASRVGSQASTAAANGATSTLGTALGVAGIGYGTYQIAENWGAGTDRAALGSGLAAAGIGLGLNALAIGLGPIGWAALIAGSALTGKMKVGKQKEQVSRDSARDNVANTGLVKGKKGNGTDNWMIENPDGSRVDIGIDGSKSESDYKPKNPNKVVDSKHRDSMRHTYDVDYTNDLDFTSGMGGISLSRLLNGNTENNTNQVGGQMGNAALGTLGRGADFTKENFLHVMQNQRAMYVKAGIKDKQTGYQMVSQMLGEKRLTHADAVGIQQSLNMIFDNDWKTAQTLMAGRWNGIKAASEMNAK